MSGGTTLESNQRRIRTRHRLSDHIMTSPGRRGNQRQNLTSRHAISTGPTNRTSRHRRLKEAVMKARSRAAARKVVVVRRSRVAPVAPLAREDRAAMVAGADAAGGGACPLAIAGCRGGAVAAISLHLDLMGVVRRHL